MTTSLPSTLIGTHQLKWLLNETYRAVAAKMGVPRAGFRSLNGSAIATRPRSNGFGSVSTSGISVTGYGTQYRSEAGRGAP